MGQPQSTKMPDDEDIPMPLDDGSVYLLKKRRPGCTGMFWRADPTGQTKLAGNREWPRDGASLRGNVVEAKGQQWLLCSQVKQDRGTWKRAPAGAAMPFEYDNHYYLEKEVQSASEL